MHGWPQPRGRGEAGGTTSRDRVIRTRFSIEKVRSSLPVSLISAVGCCCFRKLTSTGIEIVEAFGSTRLQVSRIQGFV